MDPNPIIGNLDVNYHYFNIDLADIWVYEREKFLAGATEIHFAQKIIDLARQIIVKNAEPSFGDEMREIDAVYYSKNAVDYHNADLRMRYALNYFFHKNDCYEYVQSIIIPPNDDNYSFFFALKLSQYVLKLDLVGTFLQIHLLNAFSNDFISYEKFLKRLVHQFPDFISVGLKEEIKYYIANFSPNETEAKVNVPELKEQNETKIRNKDLLPTTNLIDYQERIKIWNGTLDQLEIVYDFLNGNLIENISKEEFTNHFTGQPFKDKINWIVELNAFIDFFDNLASARKINPMIVKGNNQLIENIKSVVILKKVISNFLFKGKVSSIDTLNNIRSRFYQSVKIQSKYHVDIIDLIKKFKD
jgi:hypothetical protein